MQSNNPIFSRSPEFNGTGSQNTYGNQTYAGNGATYPGYGQTRRRPLDLGHRHAHPGAAPPSG